MPSISEFVTLMKSLEGKDGILSVSLSHGFSFADVEDVGTRTLAVVDRDEARERAASDNQGPLVLADRATIPARARRAIRPSCCRRSSSAESALPCSASCGIAADPDVTRLPYANRRTPFWPRVANPWGPSEQ